MQVFSQLARRLMHEEHRKSVMGARARTLSCDFWRTSWTPTALKNPADRTASHDQSAWRRGICTRSWWVWKHAVFV